jgi:RNA polymerase sigma-32 factor
MQYSARDQDLGRYLTDIRRFPILEFDEEQELGRRVRKSDDRKAADALANSHLRLVVRVARSYSGYGLPLAELVAEGNIGLMQAIQRFDPERGFRLSTYAMWWIRASINDYVVRSWSLVRTGTTAARKKLFFNLRRMRNDLGVTGFGDLTPDNVTTIATALNVQESEVVEMNRRMIGKDQSLNAVILPDSGDEWQDLLVDESQNQEARLVETDDFEKRFAMIGEAFGVLDARERHIVAERRLREDPLTLADLSKVYSISRERVRQIEARALEKLQAAVLAAAPSDVLAN